MVVIVSGNNQNTPNLFEIFAETLKDTRAAVGKFSARGISDLSFSLGEISEEEYKDNLREAGYPEDDVTRYFNAVLRDRNYNEELEALLDKIRSNRISEVETQGLEPAKQDWFSGIRNWWSSFQSFPSIQPAPR